jgi:multiple antibiotic resistance protein
MESVNLVVRFFALAFSALLPVINPIGSALLFLGLVGDAPAPVVRTLARKIAITTLIFLVVIELVGTAILAFSGSRCPSSKSPGGLCSPRWVGSF